MVEDIIEGATYYDGVFDDEFEVVDVESEDDVPDDEDVEVSILYDGLESVMVVSLEQLRVDQNIDVVDIPDE